MSRVYGPAMVGNDVILRRSGPSYEKRRYIDRSTLFPKEKVETEKSSAKGRLPDLFRYMLEATPAIASSETLTQAGFSEPVAKRGFHLSRTLLVPAITLVVVSGLTAAGLVYKRQIVSSVDNVKAALSSDHATPKTSPTQIAIHSSDYDSALTALMTQQININAAGKLTSVSPNTIVSWLSIKKDGAVTYISVKTNQVAGYINQVATATGGIQKDMINSATTQISNKLLSAKGLTVSL